MSIIEIRNVYENLTCGQKARVRRTFLAQIKKTHKSTFYRKLTGDSPLNVYEQTHLINAISN